MARVVILGGGFAGLAAAREFERWYDRVEDLDVVLVDRQNFMLFTPMLPEAASGAVEYQHITQPFRLQLHRARLELGEVLGVDEARRIVTLRHPVTGETSNLAYDELILALGSAPSTMGVAGVDRFALPLRTLADAEHLRNSLIASLEVAASIRDVAERDRLLRVIVVGGGFTGVEAAGELSAFLRCALACYPTLRESMLGVVLLQGEKRLLPHLPERFGKQAARVLRDRGIDIRVGVEVASVDHAGVTIKNGGRFESRTVVWAAGSEPAPFVKKLGLAVSHHGAIETRRDFSIEKHPHLWAVGDCAAVPKKNGGTYAPLAQNATREGPLVARNVLATLQGRKTKPFTYRKLGQMASLGDRHALAQLPGGKMLTGLPAWILWRTYYLGRLPGIGRKTRVALDWGIGLAFGPRIARLPMVERGETSFQTLDKIGTTH